MTALYMSFGCFFPLWSPLMLLDLCHCWWAMRSLLNRISTYFTRHIFLHPFFHSYTFTQDVSTPCISTGTVITIHISCIQHPLHNLLITWIRISFNPRYVCVRYLFSNHTNPFILLFYLPPYHLRDLRLAMTFIGMFFVCLALVVYLRPPCKSSNLELLALADGIRIHRPER